MFLRFQEKDLKRYGNGVSWHAWKICDHCSHKLVSIFVDRRVRIYIGKVFNQYQYLSVDKCPSCGAFFIDFYFYSSKLKIDERLHVELDTLQALLLMIWRIWKLGKDSMKDMK